MTNIFEPEPSGILIPGYTDASEHAKKSLSFTRKSLDTTENSSEKCKPTAENVFSPDQTDAILHKLRTFERDGLKITNCIFRRNGVEICYIFEVRPNNVAHNEDELRQQLADHLEIDSPKIKMTKLRAKPIYKETSIGPGETATIHSKGPCKIGAFVNVEGKGNHALMSGHGKNEGDLVLYPSGKQLGVVGVSLHQSLQPRTISSYLDVALTRLNHPHGCTTHVVSTDHGQLSLARQPIEAVEGLPVRHFDANGNRGRVDSTAYYRRDEELEIDWRLIAVNNDEGGPIHGEGDSGVLVVHDAPNGPNEGKVEAVGMLVGIDELPLDDAENTTKRISLAVQLTSNFEALQNHPYCNGVDISFLN